MRNIIITGGSSGLGLETAKKLALNKENRIIIACRNVEKAESAIKEITAYSKNENVKYLSLDTSLLSSVREFVHNYVHEFATVDVLINNAGISGMKGKGLTSEGFEMCFATNYLGHFLLTCLLLDHMSPEAEIINVTSDMHNPPGGILWKGMDYLKTASDDRRKYSYSKLCMIFFTHRLNKILKSEKSAVSVNSFNPGFMAATNFAGGRITEERINEVKTTMPERYGTLESSCNALAEIADKQEFKKISGGYFDRSTSLALSSPLSYDEQIEEEVWIKSLEFCGIEKSLL